VLNGVLAASLVTMALIGTLFFGWSVAGLPFVPFDVFDWLTRILPGRLIAFGIGTMVSLIRTLNLGPTSETAKLAEQVMAIAVVFIAGVVGGTILFVVLRAELTRSRLIPGLLLGIVFGIPAMLVSLLAGQTSSVGPLTGSIWILGVFLLWGEVLVRSTQRLIDFEQTSDAAVARIDRRRFLIRLGGTTAAITVAGAVVGELAEERRREAVVMAGGEPELWSRTHPLPNANATIEPAPGARPELTPLERHYRIDINTIPPKVDGEKWRLQIAGLVEKPLSLSLLDLQRYQPMHQFVTLSCISNPVGGDLIGTTRWTGVSLQQLLPDLKLAPSATHWKIRSADGFFEVVSLDAIKTDPRIMLTYSWDGVPLKRAHGYPLRIYIPDLYGMKQPKWIESIEATDHWEPGYWVRRGWNKVAQMRATSVIDTVAVDMMIIGADRNKLVPIGGIAHGSTGNIEGRSADGRW
jgi:DMSO/TMAO reductase YedYZ molybdopterin-dependent catalytic subunit